MSQPITANTPVPLRYAAGRFDIYIVVDTREVKLKKDRSYIQEQLEMHGIKTLTRSLTVGDFLWVAKLRGDASNEGQEVVLDYVIERKTMDDLIASIKDSRFKDQKLRLGNSGLRNTIYLVEKSPSMVQALNFGLTAIRTAMAQVQVVNGFFLKQTASLDETIAYLVRLTKGLIAKFGKQDLLAISSEVLNRDTFKETRAYLEGTHGCQCHLTFDGYQAINSKSKEYRVQEIWTRQLMTIKGVSGEKAVAIAKNYPTMRSLLKALAACNDDTERESLIRSAGGNGRKAIGGALAKKIRRVLCSPVY
ncbi:uncharacterized protein SPPG_01909 [Spizellomyces punctatus DAOM BR117]|uniref:Crossover junction endonuclease MUS81 n=1 Tax=Spizellomyces punctatus (strain DAOM BR117) TaxID=645134 RepID=A0A0L0HP43_SPIPD|nr:uncharacterized protein SPPG_01909 [Spizellomyces punctatus DAOM BR117]KND02828.1 hypothetical protein SPPG_01909 [Spizellomyces punctatus DAOM BR117]|eukprot:XP_016610867.1 hypothetical protein SPPG_01909 [Spizellomyces punctatus DAOM BR117]